MGNIIIHLQYIRDSAFVCRKCNDTSSVLENIEVVPYLLSLLSQLTNQGKSDLQSIQLTITYPFKKHQPKEYDYIVYPISIQVHCTVQSTIINHATHAEQ
jgi:hypothetical protein